MINNEPVPECVVCQTQELHLNTYKNYFNKELYPHLIDDVLKNTAPDGHTTLKPRSFDYRVSNQCNFKCRMCGDQLSSSWEKEKCDSDLWTKNGDPWLMPEVNNKIKNFQESVAEKKFIQALNNNQVDEIYWVGGEPLLWDLHWEQMEILVKTGKSKNIICRYNTNLSLINFKGVHLFKDLLPHFKNYIICASIDGAGKIGEYIRTGLNWEKWLSNFKEGATYITPEGKKDMFFDLTLTLPGLFSVYDLAKVATELNVSIYPKLVYAFDSSLLMSPLALPRNILENIIDKVISDVYSLDNPKMSPLIQLLENVKTRKTFREDYPDWREGFNKGKEKLQEIAKIRKDGENGRLKIKDIFSSNSEVLNWWGNKYE